MNERDRILRALDAARGQGLKARDVGEAAGFSPGEATKVKRLLRELTRDGVLVREGKRFARAGATPPAAAEKPAGRGYADPERRRGRDDRRGSPWRRERGAEDERPAPSRGGREVVGTVTVRPEGYGFLKRISGPPGEDVFLPPPELASVIDGDKLRVELVAGKFGRDAGRLIEIVERRRRHLVGVLHESGFVQPVDPGLPEMIPVKGRVGRHGQVVKVAITSDPGGRLRGTVERVVGEAGDPIVEVLAVAYKNGFAEDFPGEVRTEADRVGEEVTAEARAGRRDLTAVPLVTIDGEDARDFDDAVFVERRPNGGGYRLLVAIADVAHYVRPGTALDAEAARRATSVYFPNHVLPMLPERLSNGICSLNPGVDRLCMVADLLLDRDGRPEETEVYEGVMSSHARCTYTQVAKLLAGEAVPELSHVKEHLLVAGELFGKLRALRIARGALDFDLPEPKVVIDKDMRPVEVVLRERNDAHRLIEEFMLAANEAVARWFTVRGLPTVYRVHGDPDQEKLARLAAVAAALGFPLDVEKGLSPKELQKFLARIEGSPQQQALSTLMLRSMMQAIYTPDNIGHYGLAAEDYLHFTSPIRRYPDLLVHRELKAHWSRGGRFPAPGALDRRREELDELAASSSERERAAMEAEREIDQYFKCLFVKDRVGERFDATITGVADFGFFAVLDGTAVEGLVKAEELGSEWGLDEERFRLVFPSGVSFGVGDRVRVVIASVNLQRRQVSLVLLGDDDEETPAPPPRKKARSLKEAVDEKRREQRSGRGRPPPARKPAGKPARKPPGKGRRR